MATVIFTFFITTRFYVYKMDADSQERRRESKLSQREKRWSMNSQRLEEIVAELMKPISDVHRSFDTDLSALLEEYLTEAGLHALEADEDEAPLEPAPAAVNFAELALLLQHSASLYGRKVDLLYQRVLHVSDSLLTSTQEVAGTPSDEPATPSARRRRGPSQGAAGFQALELARSAAAAREPAAPRPPPTLPRIYIELEPRTMTDNDVPLTDYEGEPIGLLSDFHVTWRLQDGVLVDELEGSGSSSAVCLRPIPLLELSAAIAAAAPPDLPPRCSTPTGGGPPLLPPLPPLPGTPQPMDDTIDSAVEMTPEVAVVKAERKRKCEVNVDEEVGRIKLLISKALRQKLSMVQEFGVPEPWVRSVVSARHKRILSMRHQHKKTKDEPRDFRGFDCSTACGAGGFPGWSAAERPRLTAEPDSDDDGFFDQSSSGDSDGSRAGDHSHTHIQCESESDAWSEWQRGVLQRAAAGEARVFDVRALAARLLARLPPGEGRPFAGVLRAEAAAEHDVSGLFLATLFLANSGNVEIIQGAPLELSSFSVRLVSGARRQLEAAAAAAEADGVAPVRST
nr:unnamed protein product [Amyelois transitella]